MPVLFAMIVVGSVQASTLPPLPTPPARTITEERIGPVFTGGTIRQFRQEMEGTDLRFEARYMVDFSALCASVDGEERICAAFEERPYVPPFAEIAFLRTTSDHYRTVDGIGVGTLLKDAEAVWGTVTLMYSHDNESREYAEFEEGPRLGFRVGRMSDPLAYGGDYASGETGYGGRTSIYHTDAVITAIEVNGR